jgi:hypothetical protein
MTISLSFQGVDIRELIVMIFLLIRLCFSKLRVIRSFVACCTGCYEVSR